MSVSGILRFVLVVLDGIRQCHTPEPQLRMFQWCFNEPLGVRHEPFCEASLHLYSPLPLLTWRAGSRGQHLWTKSWATPVHATMFMFGCWMELSRCLTIVIGHQMNNRRCLTPRRGEVGLFGPYSEDEMSVLLGTDQWSFNPRFVLFQGASKKVRIIDDAKKSCPNNAFSSTVKLQLQDVDYVAAMGQLAC